jgi:NADH-quinone oxidoreductase subunit M
MAEFPLLSAAIFIPAIGALLILFLGKNVRNVRSIAVGAVVIDFLISLQLFAQFKEGYEFEERIDGWIPLLNSSYHLAADGLSITLILLTGLIGLVAVLGSMTVSLRVREYFIWLLLLQTSVMGVFAAQDLILFFVFWELELIPMYFLISIWGTGRKEYSAMKFIIFTLTGSAFMLVGILTLFFSTGTFGMQELLEQDLSSGLLLPTSVVFALFFIGFAVKLPLWPVHSWLPDAHTDAPTAVSVMLAGVLLKLGGYGLLRINIGFFPDTSATFAWAMATLAVISILYGAAITLRQTDLKRLIAYSSISHMGFVVLGIASVGASGGVNTIGLTGAALQLFTHGTITGLLFLLVGLVYERAHTRSIADLGGLAARMPFVTVAFLIGGLAALGLPGLSGFVAEALVFLGTFPVYGWATAAAAASIVLAAGYILWTIQRVLFGPSHERYGDIEDATWYEKIPVALLITSIVVVGLYPSLLTDVLSEGIIGMLGNFLG